MTGAALSWGLLPGVLLLAACPDGDSGTAVDGGVLPDAVVPDSQTVCGAGYLRYEQACIPQLSLTCKDHEVPQPGGSCKQVGMRTCSGGIIGPGDSACVALGPAGSCPKGWSRSVKDGWCEPVQPVAACKAGQLAPPGQTTCGPVRACGSGTWGDIKTTASTLHVDASYSGGSSDGSASKPYTTIAQALKLAGTGGQVAVAAGTYNESLTLYTGVTLEGRCPELVKIKGSASGAAAISINASGARLRGLTISGPAKGVMVVSAKAELLQVVVSNCAKPGVDLQSSQVTIKDSLIEHNTIIGVWVRPGSVATVERSVVRNTWAQNNSFGFAFQVGSTGDSSSAPAELQLSDSLLSGNRQTAVLLISAKAVIKRSLIKDTQPTDAYSGTGVYATIDPKRKNSSTLQMEDCVVAANSTFGVAVFSSTATLSRTVIRDTIGKLANTGYGVFAGTYGGTTRPATVSLKSCAVARNRDTGIYVLGSDLTLSRSVVHDTASNYLHKMRGAGVEFKYDATTKRQANGSISESLIARNSSLGVAVLSSSATISRSVVQNTRPRELDKMNGNGLLIQGTAALPARLTMSDSLVSKNSKTSVEARYATLVLDRVVVADSLPQPADNSDGTAIAARLGKLEMTDSKVIRARSSGLHIKDCQLKLQRVAIVDILPEANNKKSGLALQATASDPARYKATLTNVLVQRCRQVGLNLWISGTVDGCVISDVRQDEFYHAWGDGIVVVDRQQIQVTVRRTLVEKCRRAALMYGRTGGLVETSVFRTSTFAVDLESGAYADVLESNVYEGNKRNHVSFDLGLTAAGGTSSP